jgi:hypothetical protein
MLSLYISAPYDRIWNTIYGLRFEVKHDFQITDKALALVHVDGCLLYRRYPPSQERAKELIPLIPQSASNPENLLVCYHFSKRASQRGVRTLGERVLIPEDCTTSLSHTP